MNPTIVRNLGERLRIELTYNSNAIEGNTLTRQQTARIVEDNLSVAGKSINEILEAKNHDEALLYIEQLAKKKSKTINQNTILEIHRLILSKIDDQNSGCYRTVPVRISGSQVILPNPVKVPQLMDQFEQWLLVENDSAIMKAIEAHYQLVTIHPFVDGNGRTARLLFNMILLQQGYPLCFIKKEERSEYLSALEKAQLGLSKDDYLIIMLRSIERSLNLYLNTIKQRNVEPVQGKYLKIGQLAKATGETVPTIRYRTNEGLLSVAHKTEGGYNLYQEDSIEVVARIQQLKAQRLTLREIKERLL